MKTAMQELIFHIAYMERVKYQDEQNQIIGGMSECIMYDAIVIQNRVIEELTKEYAEYLEKEKEQHKETWELSREQNDMKVDNHYIGSDYLDFEQYYNQTYNN